MESDEVDLNTHNAFSCVEVGFICTWLQDDAGGPWLAVGSAHRERKAARLYSSTIGRWLSVALMLTPALQRRNMYSSSGICNPEAQRPRVPGPDVAKG